MAKVKEATGPATKAQIAFVVSLQAERKVPKALVTSMRNLWSQGEFDAAQASSYIDVLSNLPKNQAAIKRNDALLGYHQVGRDFYAVHRSKAGMFYVKVLQFHRKTGAARWFPNFSRSIVERLSVQTKLDEKKSEWLVSSIKAANEKAKAA